jgi:hypothetical protein
MTNRSDPLTHRQSEEQMMQHVQRLLGDDRLRIDTTQGRRPVPGFMLRVERSDHAVELKRLMSDMNLPDRELQAKMPIGETLEVSLVRKRFLLFTQVVGRLRVVCVSPTRALLAGEKPGPMTTADVQKTLASLPAAAGNVPTTVLVASTSGFTLDAHELAERRMDRTVVLAEPNGAGGWTVTGPVETKALTDLFDPEAEEQKRQRVREEIEAAKGTLSGAGVATDKLAARTQLPPQLVEAELKAYAKANPGLVARRLDGRFVLFREGSGPAALAPAGGSTMPLIDRVKTLFARKGEIEKKIAFLSERRTALSQQRERSYEEMAGMEEQEASLKRNFAEAAGTITKRRVTSQLLQLRKELERRQQLLSVLNQQVEVVSTHLHNLELVQQGQTAKLPDAEEMTADAVKAEEMLAELEAQNELALSVGQGATASLSSEEQALYEELERESGTAKPAAGATAAPPTATPAAPEPRVAKQAAPRRAEAEPG